MWQIREERSSHHSCILTLYMKDHSLRPFINHGTPQRAEALLSTQHSWDSTNQALSTVPALSTELGLWRSTLMECRPAVGELDCRAWVGSNELPSGRSFLPAPGTDIHVAAERRAATTSHLVDGLGSGNHDDGTSFLQMPPSSPPSSSALRDADSTWVPSMLDLHDVIVDFEWFDSHFTLPTFDF